jgi:hypothetical protein
MKFTSYCQLVRAVLGNLYVAEVGGRNDGFSKELVG